jgi:hypothetical protein
LTNLYELPTFLHEIICSTKHRICTLTRPS